MTVNKALVWKLKAQIRNHGFVQNPDSYTLIRLCSTKVINLVCLCFLLSKSPETV